MAGVTTVAGEPADVRSGTRSAPASLLEFATTRGLRLLLLGPSRDPNAKVTVLLVSPDSGRATFAVKAPTTAGAARVVAAEQELLTALAGALDSPLREEVPRVVDTVEVQGRTAMVTTALAGTPMTTRYLRWRHVAAPSRVAADFDAVAGWLGRFQAATAQDIATVEPDAGVTAALERRFADDPGLPGDLDALAAIHARLREQSVPRTAVHGDLWMGNVLLTGDAVTGVVDWEAGALRGEPLRDLVRFALMYALYLDRRTRPGRRVPGHPSLRAGQFGSGVEYALNGVGWFPELFREFLGRGLERLGASPAAWRDALLAGVAEVAALTDDPAFAGRQLELFRRLT
jgi:aminoglycoside phosphotransferase (APT) family kinase protein